jgi:hypothetical protein
MDNNQTSSACGNERPGRCSIIVDIGARGSRGPANFPGPATLLVA